MISTPVKILLATTLVVGLVSCTIPTTQTDEGTPMGAPTTGLRGTENPIPTVSTLPGHTATFTPVPPKLTTPSTTVLPSANPQVTSLGLPCNRAAAGNPIDITIPDDSILQAGDSFSKTWRLTNAGDCPWTVGYTLVWFSGERMGAVHESPLPKEIRPGDSVDLTVDMVAPQEPGTHQSTWKLRAKDGSLFGLGPNGDAPFWVRIVVLIPDTQTPEPTVVPPTDTPPAVVPPTDTPPAATPTEAPPPIQTPTTTGESQPANTGANLVVNSPDMNQEKAWGLLSVQFQSWAP